MESRRRAVALISGMLASLAPAQSNASDGEAAARDPIKLVAEAEALIKKKEVEDAILLLWEALDELATGKDGPIQQATRLSALYLLKEHDPREEQRRAVFAAVAKQQLELAVAYRTKKWFDVAEHRILVAAAYDPDAAAKERALLTAARAKEKPEAGAPAAAPPVEKPVNLLQRAATQYVTGSWTEVADGLEFGPAPANTLAEWISREKHEDHEIVVEFKPVDSKQPFNVILSCGIYLHPTTRSYSGYRLLCSSTPQPGTFGIWFVQVDGDKAIEQKPTFVKSAPDAQGFHRLAIQVSGAQLRGQLDGTQPTECTATEPLRGFIGVLVGLSDAPSGKVQLRNLRIEPLPADRPTDEELRAEAIAKAQSAITRLVDESKQLIADKKPEAASMRLRSALQAVAQLPAGVLRDSLQATIEPMLAKSDPLAPKRKKAAGQIAADLAALADVYKAAGVVRAARDLMARASSFDPVTIQPRLVEAEAAVEAWNVRQATARAAELAPPNDDGAVLMQHFAGAQLIDSRSHPWTVADGTASVIDLPVDGYTALGCKAGLPAIVKASVHVRLHPSTLAGIAFDVAGPFDYASAYVFRNKTGLGLVVYRYANGKWILLGRKMATIDRWRLDGWHGISVESSATGAVVQAAGLELKIPRSRLGIANGRFGLAASNEGEVSQTLAFRALQVTKVETAPAATGGK